MEDIKRKPMPLYVRFHQYNNDNLHEYDPYIISSNVLLIDERWWDTLTPFMKSEVVKKVSDFEIVESIPVPHAVCDSHPSLTCVYRAYLDGFDYHQWYSPNLPNGPKDVILIHLNEALKNSLLKRNAEDVNIVKLIDSVKKVISPGQQYFMRLSGTSGKNEKAVTPLKTANEIVDRLLSVDMFRRREYERSDKDTYLVLMPWNDKIESRCEFRIFVVNNKLTAASPQRYWELHQFSYEELEAFETALKNIAFIGYVPYHTFVADVYIDVDTAVCHLIELNPFGAHSGAGSSFFNWVDDYEILYGLTSEGPELRYLSAINY